MVTALKKVKDPSEYFLFFDMYNSFRFAEQLQDLGFNGNFPTAEDRAFEIDRDKGKQFVKKYYPRVFVAEVQDFKKVEDARKFLEETDRVWALKGKSEDATTVVPSVDDPMLAAEQILEELDGNPSVYEQNGFILEEKIMDPIELTPQRMYYNGELIFTDLDLELKKLGAGDTGFMTGCAADLVFPIPNNCKLADIAFPPIVAEMAKKHKGLFIWDISLLVDPKTNKMYMGEFCPNRLGWNAFYTEVCQLSTVTDFFEGIVKQKNPYEYAAGKYGVSVRLFNLPDKPAYMEQGADLKNKKISWAEEVDNYLYLMDVYKKAGNKITSGYTWDLAIVAATGDTVYDAVERCYNAVKGVSFSGVYYRPKSDYLSMDYPGSIMVRYDYVNRMGLIYERPEVQQTETKENLGEQDNGTLSTAIAS